MSLELENKVVIVTGAGGGVGRRLALGLAARGACVVVNDPGTASGDGSAAVDEVVAAIRGAGGTAVASLHRGDESDGARQIVELARRVLGRVDAVVNSAGLVQGRVNFRPSGTRRLVDRHYEGSMQVSHAAADVFAAQRGGSLVHILTQAALLAGAGTARRPSGGGVVALSRQMATTLARAGARSNCIAPFAWDGPDEEPGADDPVAALAAFLAGDLSRDVTGQVFALRAGEMVRLEHGRIVGPQVSRHRFCARPDAVVRNRS